MPQRRAETELAKVDLLLVPTALHHYTVEEIQEEEVRGDEVLPTSMFWFSDVCPKIFETGSRKHI